MTNVWCTSCSCSVGYPLKSWMPWCHTSGYHQVFSVFISPTTLGLQERVIKEQNIAIFLDVGWDWRQKTATIQWFQISLSQLKMMEEHKQANSNRQPLKPAIKGCCHWWTVSSSRRGGSCGRRTSRRHIYASTTYSRTAQPGAARASFCSSGCLASMMSSMWGNRNNKC